MATAAFGGAGQHGASETLTLPPPLWRDIGKKATRTTAGQGGVPVIREGVSAQEATVVRPEDVAVSVFLNVIRWEERKPVSSMLTN